MKKPNTRLSKPLRHRMIPPTLAENIAIMRGIAADRDAQVVSNSDMRRMRPFPELVVLRRIPHARRGTTAAAFLIGEQRMRIYLLVAEQTARDLKMPSILSFAESAIAQARRRIGNNEPRPKG